MSQQQKFLLQIIQPNISWNLGGDFGGLMVRDFLIMEILIDSEKEIADSKPQKAAQPKPQASRLGLDTISGDC